MRSDPLVRSAVALATSDQLVSAVPAQGSPPRLTLWRAAREQDLNVLSWGDFSAIHHRSSGKTHFVNRSSLVLLTNVLVGSKSTRQAAQELAGAMGVQPSDEFEAQVLGLLVRLDELGLVQRLAAPETSLC